MLTSKINSVDGNGLSSKAISSSNLAVNETQMTGKFGKDNVIESGTQSLMQNSDTQTNMEDVNKVVHSQIGATAENKDQYGSLSTIKEGPSVTKITPSQLNKT